MWFVEGIWAGNTDFCVSILAFGCPMRAIRSHHSENSKHTLSFEYNFSNLLLTGRKKLLKQEETFLSHIIKVIYMNETLGKYGKLCWFPQTVISIPLVLKSPMMNQRFLPWWFWAFLSTLSDKYKNISYLQSYKD
jgi:hypothetical protein